MVKKGKQKSELTVRKNTVSVGGGSKFGGKTGGGVDFYLSDPGIQESQDR